MKINNNTILIIAVIYNSYRDTVRYIESLEKFTEKNIKLILADNSEKKASEEFESVIKSSSLDIDYFKTERNLGYFGGAKSGLERYLKSNDMPQWVIVSNVDIEFDDNSFFRNLEKLNGNERIGAVAPSIISKTWQIDLNPKIEKRYSKKKMYFYKFITSAMLIQNSYILLGYIKKYIQHLLKGRKQEADKQDKKEIKKIYAPHGSCILLHRNYFEKGGTLNHISFLFGEEIFIAETANKINLDVIYNPELSVLDHEHTSTGFFYSQKMSKLMHVSTNDIIEVYYK